MLEYMNTTFQISTRTDEIIYKMISPERSDSTAVFIPDNKAGFETLRFSQVQSGFIPSVSNAHNSQAFETEKN